MILFKNTDNGRILQVPDNEAFIYDRASNFERVLAEVPKRQDDDSNIPRRKVAKK